MKKTFLSYKTSIILILMIFGSVFLGIFYSYQLLVDDADVYNVSQKHYETKSSERTEVFNSFINSYATVIDSVSENHDVKRFLDGTGSLNNLNDHLISTMNAVNYITDIVLTTPRGSVITHIKDMSKRDSGIKKKQVNQELDYKLSVDFKNEIEHMNTANSAPIKLHPINIEDAHHCQKDKSQHATVIISKTIFKENLPQAILLFKVCLHHFFQTFSKTTLYDVYLLNSNEEIILSPSLIQEHHDSTSNLSLESVFNKSDIKHIHDSPYFFGGYFYSALLKPQFSDAQYKLVLVAKYQSMAEENRYTANLLFILMSIAILFTLPLGIRLSKEPQKLLNLLDQQAYFDEVTGLPNKASLKQRIESKPDYSLIIISMDDFDDLETLYGSPIINELIKQIAMFIVKSTSENEMELFYLEKGNFALSFEHKNHHDLELALSGLHQLIENQTFQCADNIELNISVTLGTNTWNKETISPHETISAALLSVQNSRILRYPYLLGGDYSKTEIEKEFQERMRMLELIRAAATEKTLVIHYQPIFCTKTNKITKHEALIRIPCEYERLCYPGQFLELAKTTKYYTQFTELLIKRVVKKLQELPAEQSISINFNMLDFTHKEIISTLYEEGITRGLAERIIIEIVESDDYGDFQQLLESLQALHQQGFKIAIDDFGSGYSNFKNLIQLKGYVDYLKIDGSIVKSIAVDSDSEELFSNIINFAHGLGFETVAEFIHDEATKEKALEYQVDYLQGYCIGEPKANIDK